MRRRFASWRAWHLFLLWGAYWIALLLWGFGRAIPIIMRVSKPDANGSASANFGSGGLHFSITQNAGTVWQLDVALSTVIVLITAGPLVLWVFWLWAQRGASPGDPTLLDEGDVTANRVDDRASAVDRRPRD